MWTGNPILLLVLHPQKMSLLSCENFGKRREKAIQCQTEMWVNTTDSDHKARLQQQGKVLNFFSFYFKSKNTFYIQSDWKLTSLYFKGDLPHFPTRPLWCPPQYNVLWLSSNSNPWPCFLLIFLILPDFTFVQIIADSTLFRSQKVFRSGAVSVTHCQLLDLVFHCWHHMELIAVLAGSGLFTWTIVFLHQNQLNLQKWTP